MTTPLSLAERPLTLNLIQQMSKVIDSQKREKPYGDIFARPVDYETMEIPDYPKIVKHPMDFTTLQKNLNARVFENLSEFLEQLTLIFSNCILYNGDSNNGYFKVAAVEEEKNAIAALQTIFEDLTFDNYLQVLALGEVKADIQSEFQSANEPKIEDIQELVRKMSELTDSALGDVLQIFMEEKKLEMKPYGDDEINIELRTTDGQLIWKMMACCDVKLEEIKRKKKSKR